MGGGRFDGGTVGQQPRGSGGGGVDLRDAACGFEPPGVGGVQDGNGHEVGTFSSPARRPISNSLCPRKAVAIETSSWRADLKSVPRKFLLAGGPHWANPDAVNGARPGSSVLSNRSPSAKCSNKYPSGSR